MSSPVHPLLPLVQELRACSSRDTSISEKSLREAWDRFKADGWVVGKYPPVSVLLALVIHDEVAVGLLPDEARAQLWSLAEQARCRYLELTQPPNQIGKLLAATIEENP